MSTSVPFLPVYQQTFSCGLIQVYHYSGTGPGNSLAASALFAANIDNEQSATGKNIETIGQIASYALSTLSQCEVNALRLAQLTNTSPPNVLEGSRNPLALDFDPEGVKQYEALINQTAFYGKDGLQDIGGWPNVTIQMRKERGYKFVSQMVSGPSYPKICSAIINTGPLTELFKTLEQLAKSSSTLDLNALFIDAGTTMSLADAKTENGANIMADVQAAQNVFMFSKILNIPIIFCPPQLAEEIGLLFSTKEQPEALRAINNSVTNQLAALTEKMPHLEAGLFLNASYPVPEALTAEALLDPDLYTVKQVAASIGPNGQLQIDENAPDSSKTVYILDVPAEKKPLFYKTLIARFKNFDPGTQSSKQKAADYTMKVLLGIFGTILGAGILAGTAAVVCKCKNRSYTKI